MSNSLASHVTAHFYDWEKRGRGWLWFDQPIQLEPPFHPFFFHPRMMPQVIDDGVRPTLISSVINLVKNTGKAPVPPPASLEPSDIDPFLFECDEELTVFAVSFPKGYKTGIREMEQLLIMLSDCMYPVSFEIIGSHTAISLQLTCRQSDTRYLISQLKAHFPVCRLAESPDHITDIIQNGDYASIIDFGLKEEFMRPLATIDSLKHDPYTSLFGILDHLEAHENLIMQVLFHGTINPWGESIMRSVMDNQGNPFFADAPEMVPLAREKVTSPFFGVVLRILAESDTLDHAYSLSKSLATSLGRIYTGSGNSLVPHPPDIPFDFRLKDILTRQSHRLGMLLNTKELASLAHFPTEAVTAAKLVRDTRKTKKAPHIALGHDLILGSNEHTGGAHEVSVSTEQRLKHCHIIGATGTGKSTLLLNLITNDIKQGHAIGVLDPHGDLIDAILRRIPEQRIKDVVLIDPSDSEYAVGFNILTAHSDIEKELLSSDLVSVFRRLSTSWGDQMNSVFANAILALLESDTGGTLVDLRRFLIEKDFRERYLKTVTDPNIVYYWQKEYPLLKSSSIGPILTRLDTFLRPKPIRYMVAQHKSLDIDALMNTNSIILMKLSQGLIGTENSYLLGTFLVSKIYQTALARQAQAMHERNPFFLYIDEFQNFITPSLSSILSGARKYGLGLTLAHQDMQQLTKHDSELANSIVSNAGTRICFRLGDADAKRFESGFSYFDRSDLENLQRGEAIARIEKPEYDFNFITREAVEPDITLAEKTVHHILAHSRATYGTPTHEVEALFEKLQCEITLKTRQNDQTDLQRQPEKNPIPPLSVTPIKTDPRPAIEIADPILIESLVKRKTQSEHRYLQMYIKRMAEGRGYIAKVEEPTPDGKGRVDVSLEKSGKRIACEICCTTEVDWEIHNLQKCLQAGYDLIVACSNNAKSLEAIRCKALEAFNTPVFEKVLFFEPEQFFVYLDQQLAKETSTETRIRGYRVHVEYNTVSEIDMARKKESVGKAILSAIKKT